MIYKSECLFVNLSFFKKILDKQMANNINLAHLRQAIDIVKIAADKDHELDLTSEQGQVALRSALDLVKQVIKGPDVVDLTKDESRDDDIIAVIAVRMAEFESLEIMVVYEEDGTFSACWRGHNDNSSRRIKKMVSEFVMANLP